MPNFPSIYLELQELWKRLRGVIQDITKIKDDIISIQDDIDDGGPPTGPAGGVLSGSYPNPSAIQADVNGNLLVKTKHANKAGFLIDDQITNFSLKSNNKSGTFEKTADITISTGDSDLGTAGDITLKTGEGSVSNGTINIISAARLSLNTLGALTDASGDIEILCGNSNIHSGADVKIWAGDGVGGGNIAIAAGNAPNGSGGNIYLTSGTGALGTGGNVVISAPDNGLINLNASGGKIYIPNLEADTSPSYLLTYDNSTQRVYKTSISSVGPSNNFTGDIIISSGNVVVDSGYGIDFTSTSGPLGGATVTKEKLLDYEEGIWTGNLVGDWQRAEFRSGSYTKIGSTVFITATIVPSGSESDFDFKRYDTIENLPYLPDSNFSNGDDDGWPVTLSPDGKDDPGEYAIPGRILRSDTVIQILRDSSQLFTKMYIFGMYKTAN